MRTQNWLEEQLQGLIREHFPEMPIQNELKIRFGRSASRRFGSIQMSLDKRVSLIRINGAFRDEKIPEAIIKATIAHELCHYAHGFSSPLPKLYDHPHRGNVIAREFKKRGLMALHEYEKLWTKNNWKNFIPDRPRRGLARGLRRRWFL
ncbi:MAG: hypothetical protein AAB802_04795 [Patescibacteria group bacterium]